MMKRTRKASERGEERQNEMEKEKAHVGQASLLCTTSGTKGSDDMKVDNERMMADWTVARSDPQRQQWKSQSEW
ncbi:hypothetical protein Q7C36_007490 [Tachysurus vachellii]|uniref:Uncharacterized protein n=1 Tax=Tachysurus vachellii TaxID=175792 RepID=A0AA88N5J6_TACVA|nr:hypothetical protein Q7C36_007490 [Tachysurus vachellii]